MQSTRGMMTRRSHASAETWTLMSTEEKLAWLEEASSTITVSRFDSDIVQMQFDDDTLESLATFAFGTEPAPRSKSKKFQCTSCHEEIYGERRRAHIWPSNNGTRCSYWSTPRASIQLREILSRYSKVLRETLPSIASSSSPSLSQSVLAPVPHSPSLLGLQHLSVGGQRGRSRTKRPASSVSTSSRLSKQRRLSSAASPAMSSEPLPGPSAPPGPFSNRKEGPGPIDSVDDVICLLEGTEGPGKQRWRPFVSYLRNNKDKFELVQPCTTGPPDTVPDNVRYYPQGSAVIDSFLDGVCSSCRSNKNHPLCSKKHEVLDYHTVFAAAIRVASDVDEGNPGYDGKIVYRATASGVADVPPPDGVVNQKRMSTILAGDNAPESIDPRTIDCALATFVYWPKPKVGVIPHILWNAYDKNGKWEVSDLGAPGAIFCPPGHYTPFHIDLVPGHILHLFASGWKLWIFIPHGEPSFQSQQWGFDSDLSLEAACANASKIQLVVTAPRSILLTPPNIIHSVITLGLPGVTPIAIHNSIDTLHRPSVVDEVKKAIPIYLGILRSPLALNQLGVYLDKEMYGVLKQGKDHKDHKMSTRDYNKLYKELKAAIDSHEVESE